jgi:DNA-binding response OmpR family regulator
VRTLTQKEAEVFRYFMSRPNSVIKRSELLENIWGEDDYFLGRSLDVFISRLRKYIKDDASLEIVNLHGVGFKLETR